MEPLLCLAIALGVSPFAVPLTLYVTSKFGLVGGTPRELLAVQLELEKKKAALEDLRLEIAREELNLRKERQTLETKLKLAEIEARKNPPPRPIVNPSLGFRG